MILHLPEHASTAPSPSFKSVLTLILAGTGLALRTVMSHRSHSYGHPMADPTRGPGILRRAWDSVLGDLSDLVLILGTVIIVLVPTCGIGYALGGDDGLKAGFIVGSVILVAIVVVALIAGVVFLVQIAVALMRGERDVLTVEGLAKLESRWRDRRSRRKQGTA